MARAEFKPVRVAFSVFLAIAAISAVVSWSMAVNKQRQTSSSLSNDVLRASGQIDLLIDRLRLATQSLGQAMDPETATFDVADQSISSVAGFRTALAISPEGLVLDDSRPGKPALGINLSDRSYIEAHERPGSGFYVGRPVYSRIDGVWNLPTSLPVFNEDGGLRAIAVIAVGVDYFHSVREIMYGVGAQPFIRRQGYDGFLPLGDREAPEFLGRIFAQAQSTDQNQDLGASLFETPAGLVFTYSSAIGDFDLAVLLPQAEIARAFRSDFGLCVALGLVFATFCGLLSGASAKSWQTYRHQVEQTQRLEERLRLATHAAHVGIWDMNLTTQVLAWDKTMLELYGLAEADFHGTYADWRSCLHPDDVEDAEAEFSRCVEAGEPFTSRFRIISKATVRYIQTEASVIKNSEGQAVRVLGVNFDITEHITRERELEEARSAAEEMHAKVEKAALRDSLTGLFNRRGLEAAIETADRMVGDHTIIAIDLDRFKLVNDSLGHHAGDLVLRAVSDRLQQIKGPEDVVARIGGDEFVVLRPGADPKATEEWAQDATLRLAEPVLFNESVCRFGVSIGAAHGSVDALQSGELAQCADHALYQSKRDGRGLFRYFTEQLSQSLADRKALSNDLEQAIFNDEFSMLYMPKLEVATGRIMGLEALIRWHHPERGVLLPGAFLGLAEDLKLTGQIDGHVLDLVLHDREIWQQQGLIPPTVSVNVSTRRLKEPDLVNTVMSKAFPRGAINFELLESVFLDDVPSDVSESLKRLRSQGIGIEIDDFGSGHASILAIHKIEPDFIKIDRALISDIDEEEPARQTVSSIIDMASSHGVKVIAEGVERETQMQVLRDLGCSGAQGFLLGKPQPASEVLEGFDLRQVA